MSEYRDSYDDDQELRADLLGDLETLLQQQTDDMPNDIASLRRIADGSAERLPGWSVPMIRVRMVLQLQKFVCLISTRKDALSVEEAAGILADSAQQYLDSLET
tara:strand:+ start:854 stop:1165 length:312 start_codon:yes stop_codon:yes gene_type:complete